MGRRKNKSSSLKSDFDIQVRKVKSKIVTSDSCESCIDKCVKGTNYLNSIVLGVPSKGVACYK